MYARRPGHWFVVSFRGKEESKEILVCRQMSTYAAVAGASCHVSAILYQVDSGPSRWIASEASHLRPIGERILDVTSNNQRDVDLRRARLGESPGDQVEIAKLADLRDLSQFELAGVNAYTGKCSAVKSIDLRYFK